MMHRKKLLFRLLDSVRFGILQISC